MLTYQELDTIADAYIPTLLIISLVVFVIDIPKQGFKRKLNEFGSLIIAVLLVYAIMTIDNYLEIWPKFHLDYSTHTALSLVFVVYLSAKNMTLLALSALSFVLYVLLMLYQEYHTLADIISTFTILILPFWALLFRPPTKQSYLAEA